MAGRKCKICTSAYAKEINDMLSKGVPYSVIVKWAHDRAFDLSSMTVSRHKNRCLAGAKTATARAVVATKQKKRTDKTGRKAAKRLERVIVNANPNYTSDDAYVEKGKSYERYVKQLQGDIDILNELLWTMGVSKERVDRAIQEETNSGLVLATTGSALKDYGNLLSKFHDITSGMDSLQQIRYVQLVQMLNLILCNSAVSDRTRFELMELLQDQQLKRELEEQVAQQQEKVEKNEREEAKGA